MALWSQDWQGRGVRRLGMGASGLESRWSRQQKHTGCYHRARLPGKHWRYVSLSNLVSHAMVQGITYSGLTSLEPLRVLYCRVATTACEVSIYLWKKFRSLCLNILYDRKCCVRGLVLLASRFPFVYVETYTNGNRDDNKTEPRTRRCRSYSSGSPRFIIKEANGNQLRS